jgi:predicted CoA-binding protein
MRFALGAVSHHIEERWTAASLNMNHDTYDDAYLRAILDETETIAMVGASPHWNRPSYFAMKYLQAKGYRVVPVNPAAAGKKILGEDVYAALHEIPGFVDMVDVFRSSDAAAGIVDETIMLAREKSVRTVWMQIGVRDDQAAQRAEQAGLRVVMNRCPKIEYARLHAELGWGGIVSNLLSSRRRRL